MPTWSAYRLKVSCVSTRLDSMKRSTPAGGYGSREISYGERRVFIEVFRLDKALEQVPTHGEDSIEGDLLRRASIHRKSIARFRGRWWSCYNINVVDTINAERSVSAKGRS